MKERGEGRYRTSVVVGVFTIEGAPVVLDLWELNEEFTRAPTSAVDVPPFISTTFAL